MRLSCYLAFFILVGSLSGCSGILMNSSTKIKTTEGAKIFHKGKYYGQTRRTINWASIYSRHAIDDRYDDLELEIYKKGYKPRNEVIYPTGFNFITLVSVLTGPLAILELSSYGYHKNIPKEKEFYLEKYPDYSDSAFHISFERVFFDTSNINKNGRFYRTVGHYEKDKEPKETYHKPYLKNISTSNTRKWLNRFLIEAGAYDTTSFRIGNYDQFSIYATVRDYNVNKVHIYKSGDMRTMDLITHFKVYNSTGKLVYKKTLHAESGKFLDQVPVDYLLRDAFNAATLEVLKNNELHKHINKRKTEPNQTFEKYIQQTTTGNSDFDIDQLSTEAYYLKTQSDNKAICLPIVKDGIMAVSHKAYDYADTLKVYDHEGNSFDAEFITGYHNKEIALLKADKTFSYTVPLAEADHIDYGENVYSIGYETYFQEFLITSGVINADRYYNEEKYLQIDTESAPLYHPATFNEAGQLIGFTSRSLLNSTVSGIAFTSTILKD